MHNPFIKEAFGAGLLQGALAAGSRFLGTAAAHGPAVAKAVGHMAVNHVVGNPIGLAKDIASKGLGGVAADHFNAPRPAGMGAMKGTGNALMNAAATGLMSGVDVGARGGLTGAVQAAGRGFQRAGGTSALGTVGHNALHYGGKALAVGIPAAQLGMAAIGPREQRGSNIGGALASIAVSPFTSRLGMPGTALQGMAASVGRRLGSGFNPAPHADPNDPRTHAVR